MSRVLPAALLVLALATAPVLAGCGEDTETEQGLATPGATAPPPLPTTETAVPQPPKTPAPGQEDPASPAPDAATTTLEAPGATPPPRAPTVTEVQRPSKPVRCPAAAGFKGGDDAGGSGGFDARELLGLEIARAKALAKNNDCAVRVVNRDGQELVRTMDYSNARINVTETEGRIVALNGIG